MVNLYIILFVIVAALWFFINEFPALFGIYVPTRAVRSTLFKIIVAVTLTGSVAISSSGDISSSIQTHFSNIIVDDQSLLLVILAAFITLLVLKLFSINGSAIYALIGALEAYRIASNQVADMHIFISFAAAPVAAFIISASLRYICKLTLDRCHIHIITLSHYLRYAVISGLIILAFAVGLNWGGFLFGGSTLIGDSQISWVVIILVVALSTLFLSSFIKTDSDESTGRFGDCSIYTVLATGYSVAITMILFSFDTVVGKIGLTPAPLSAGSLLLAAIAGTEIVQKARVVENDEYTREGLAMVIAPLGSMLVAYSILHLTGRNEEKLVDFTVMAAAMAVLASLFFVGYVRRQKAQKEATDRLVYSQQQQIYEHSRALNDMELKVILSENQALHNAVEMKRQEIMNVALSIVEQREYLESLTDMVKQLSAISDDKERNDMISQLSASLKQRLSHERDVDSQYFYAQAESLHEDFSAKLAENFPSLTPQDRRLATLLRLGFSSKYIATLMNITPKSVEISRYRLRQKLGLSKGDNLVNFIKSI